MPNIIKVATRKSPLAQAQTAQIISNLKQQQPLLEFQTVILETQGDLHIDTPLHQIGGKGVFVSSLEKALRNKEADFAVHCIKDMPSKDPDDLALAAITTRSYPFDVWIGKQSWEDIQPGACIGTSSPRRSCQLLALRPDLKPKPLRGNVGSRLKKLQQGQYDAIILAQAGLERLGNPPPYRSFDLETMIPAGGQGALGLQCLGNNQKIIELLKPLNHEASAAAVQAERLLLHLLGGHCHAPIAVYAHQVKNQLQLHLCIGRKQQAVYRDRVSGNPKDLSWLHTFSEKLLQLGAKSWIAEYQL
jgi:hydroxymethylbilane synthase